jgi:hypothetical protein
VCGVIQQLTESHVLGVHSGMLINPGTCNGVRQCPEPGRQQGFLRRHWEHTTCNGVSDTSLCSCIRCQYVESVLLLLLATD